MPDALMVLARHRFATARQLAARLALDVTEVTATCTALVAEGALRELRQSTLVTRDGAAPAYALTHIGLTLVAVDPATCRPRATRTLRSAFSLAHELLVNELALALEVLDARGALRLLSWTTARESLADVAFLAERGRPVRVPLVADALAVVEHHGERVGLLIEIDMGTVSAATMRRKYAAYHAWWSEGGPVRRKPPAKYVMASVDRRPHGSVGGCRWHRISDRRVHPRAPSADSRSPPRAPCSRSARAAA